MKIIGNFSYERTNDSRKTRTFRDIKHTDWRILPLYENSIQHLNVNIIILCQNNSKWLERWWRWKAAETRFWKVARFETVSRRPTSTSVQSRIQTGAKIEFQREDRVAYPLKKIYARPMFVCSMVARNRISHRVSWRLFTGEEGEQDKK